jgi:hypothetical protein
VTDGQPRGGDGLRVQVTVTARRAAAPPDSGHIGMHVTAGPARPGTAFHTEFILIPQLWKGFRMEILGKRNREESHTVETVDDVHDWLQNVIHSGGMGNVNDAQKRGILDSVRSNEIDREVLKSLSEGDFENVLGVKVFGQRRKLKERIKELFAFNDAISDVCPAFQSSISPTQPTGQTLLTRIHLCFLPKISPRSFAKMHFKLIRLIHDRRANPFCGH